MANKTAKVVTKKEAKVVPSAGQLGNWAIWLGILVAALAVFLPSLLYSSVILVVLGLVGGYILVSDKDAHHFIIYAFGLWLGDKVLIAPWPFSPIMGIFEGFVSGLIIMFSAAALIVALKALAKVVGLIK